MYFAFILNKKSFKYTNRASIINNDIKNQIEYIFEVVTKEPDVEKDYKSELI